jgi:hypothetical protein
LRKKRIAHFVKGDKVYRGSKALSPLPFSEARLAEFLPRNTKVWLISSPTPPCGRLAEFLPRTADFLPFLADFLPRTADFLPRSPAKPLKE